MEGTSREHPICIDIDEGLWGYPRKDEEVALWVFPKDDEVIEEPVCRRSKKRALYKISTIEVLPNEGVQDDRHFTKLKINQSSKVRFK